MASNFSYCNASYNCTSSLSGKFVEKAPSLPIEFKFIVNELINATDKVFERANIPYTCELNYGTEANSQIIKMLRERGYWSSKVVKAGGCFIGKPVNGVIIYHPNYVRGSEMLIGSDSALKNFTATVLSIGLISAISLITCYLI